MLSRADHTEISIRTDLRAIFVSLELSRTIWLVTSLSPGAREKMSKHSMHGEKRDYVRHCRPRASASGCRLMGIARSTFYDKPAAQDDTAIVEAMTAICDEFEFYGWRRVRAELRHRGLIVNHKKVRRLMREHDLQPRQRRRYVATTDSDHDQPVYSNRTKDLTIDGPNQLWVADITYVAIRSPTSR